MTQNNLRRIIVCGSRNFTDKEYCFCKLNELVEQFEDVEIISGHASGADALAEDYAAASSIKITIFKAEWKKYGKAAGPIRNAQMLAYAKEAIPLVAAFWDGKSKGTRNMIERAQRSEVRVIIYNF